MLKKLKWRIKRIWKGPGTTTHGSSQSDWTIMVVNDGGLESKLKKLGLNLWRHAKKFSVWIIAAAILAAIGFFVPYLLSRFK